MSRLISRPYEGTEGGEMKQMRHATCYSKQHIGLYELTVNSIQELISVSSRGARLESTSDSNASKEYYCISRWVHV